MIPPTTSLDPKKPIEATTITESIGNGLTFSGSNGRGHKLAKAILDEIAGKRFIPIKNNFYTILAQCPDSSYVTLVSTNPKKDLEAINKGERLRYKNLPVELVYQRAHNNKKDADIVREIISKYKLPQKDKLIRAFERQFSSG